MIIVSIEWCVILLIAFTFIIATAELLMIITHFTRFLFTFLINLCVCVCVGNELF